MSTVIIENATQVLGKLKLQIASNEQFYFWAYEPALVSTECQFDTGTFWACSWQMSRCSSPVVVSGGTIWVNGGRRTHHSRAWSPENRKEKGNQTETFPSLCFYHRGSDQVPYTPDTTTFQPWRTAPWNCKPREKYPLTSVQCSAVLSTSWWHLKLTKRWTDEGKEVEILGTAPVSFDKARQSTICRNARRQQIQSICQRQEDKYYHSPLHVKPTKDWSTRGREWDCGNQVLEERRRWASEWQEVHIALPLSSDFLYQCGEQ